MERSAMASIDYDLAFTLGVPHGLDPAWAVASPVCSSLWPASCPHFSVVLDELADPLLQGHSHDLGSTVCDVAALCVTWAALCVTWQHCV